MGITRSVVVSIVGRPNTGKSTLTNRLVGRKIAIVSRKPQTTRTRITGLLNKDSCQYVFLDTPGFHRPKSRLGDYMVNVVRQTVSDVDVAVLVVEPIPNIGEPEKELIKKIKGAKIPSILAINKIDTVKKEELLEVISVYSDAHDFDEIIPISAKSGDGCETLLSALEGFSIEGDPLFPEDMISDQPEKQIAAEIIREKLLRLIDKEIPHGTAVEIEEYKDTDDGILEISANIYCEKESHKGIIIGKNGAMLKSVGQAAREDMERAFETKVFLQLWVKVREGWRNNIAQIRNFGYDDR